MLTRECKFDGDLMGIVVPRLWGEGLEQGDLGAGDMLVGTARRRIRNMTECYESPWARSVESLRIR